jgi:hypothetical protein
MQGPLGANPAWGEGGLRVNTPPGGTAHTEQTEWGITVTAVRCCRTCVTHMWQTDSWATCCRTQLSLRPSQGHAGIAYPPPTHTHHSKAYRPCHDCCRAQVASGRDSHELLVRVLLMLHFAKHMTPHCCTTSVMLYCTPCKLVHAHSA